MRTPKEYSDNLKNGIITEAMLVDCLYSANKRAKNCRDKAREYRAYYRSHRHAVDWHRNADQYTAKKEEYYGQKEKLLSVLQPVCIHREFLGYTIARRIYDYESDYNKYTNKFVYESCYYDYNAGRAVYFGDIEDKNRPRYHYYLFYDINGTKTFHTPIQEEDVEKYNLEIVDIDQLKTEGHDISDLISNQFVQKVLTLIDSKSYKLVLSEGPKDTRKKSA